MRSAERCAALACLLVLAGCAGMDPLASGPAPVPAETQRVFNDAVAAQRAGQTAQAEQAFRALTTSQPALAGPHANLGLIARKAGKLDDASAELETAVKLSPQQPLYRNELGITYRQQGRFDDARKAYEEALSLDARYASAALNLGILHDMYLGDPQKALEYYDRYLAIAPDAQVTKWVADIKNRKPRPVNTAQLQERP